jgi:putative SOS response-associated peptidase YedK
MCHLFHWAISSHLLRPAPNDLLRMWPVWKRVNVSGRGDDDPSLIEPVEANATGYP